MPSCVGGAVEWIPGGDDALWSLGAYLAPGGEALATFCFRKLRQDPRLLGNGRVLLPCRFLRRLPRRSTCPIHLPRRVPRP